jgi:hypothetical protein
VDYKYICGEVKTESSLPRKPVEFSPLSRESTLRRQPEESSPTAQKKDRRG